MLEKTKALPAITAFTVVLVMFFINYVYAQEGWFRPLLFIREQYDDNIYLTKDDQRDDWITTVSPGFVIDPRLGKHKFTFDYRADLNFFSDYDDENNNNHTTNAVLGFNFNKVRLDLTNMFHYFSDRSGSEDTNRIPRTQDYGSSEVTFGFNKMDLALKYNYRLEKYRSDDAIGSFLGQALSYKDLERNEHEGEIELALKLWTKTMLLFSGDYGVIDHDTGKKSDSDYFDVLVGLRGEPTAKCTMEAKIGYRGQDYENYPDDFGSVAFRGSLIERFTSRDILRFDFLRTTNETNYKDNAYYKNTFFSANFKHGFTDRVFGNIDCSYQCNSYPTETTEASETAHREDDTWSGGLGLSYELPKWFTTEVKYEYTTRDSNFSSFNYNNNRVSVDLTGKF